jgi:DNA-binding MarR family transcriptional regulator
MTQAVDSLDISRQYWQGDLAAADRFFTIVSVLRLSRRIIETMDNVLRAHHVNRNGYLVLMSLELSGPGSMILGRLAQELIVHPTTITLAVDKLEADGLVKKAPHEDDRRAIRVAITRRGRALAKRVTGDLQAAGFGLGELSDAEAARLYNAVNIARRSVGDIEP